MSSWLVRALVIVGVLGAAFGLGWELGRSQKGEQCEQDKRVGAEEQVRAQGEAIKTADERDARSREVESEHAHQEQQREVETRVITRDVIRYVAKPESECVADAEWVRLYNASNGMPRASKAAGKPAGGAE